MDKIRSKTDVKKDIFSLLTKDHDKVRTLFKKLVKEKEGKERKEIFEKIVIALDYHMLFEETYFYPEFKDTKLNFDILEAEEEHQVGKNILTELKSENKNTDKWLAKATVLKEIIEHHVKEEEDGLFVKARKILDKDKIVELANQFIMEKPNAI